MLTTNYNRMGSSTEIIPKEYPKRPGTSGIRGQLYETKLLSLIYFRALHDEQIEDFYLATNVDKIGSFDDICFRTKFKGIDKPLTVVIQAKHRENNNSVTTLSNTDLAEYFNSYLEIRGKFKPKNENVLFEGTFSETECLFVIYTTAKGDKDTKPYKGSFAEQLNALIGTGHPGSQPFLDFDHEKLCKSVLEEQLKALAQLMAKYICGEFNDRQMLMQDELVLRYHVILAQRVFDVSDNQSEGYRVASCRKDFFYINDDYLENLFKNRLLTELFKKKSSLTQLLLTCGELFKHHLPRSTEKEEEEEEPRRRCVSMLEDRFSSLEFKVPASFGNKDLSLKGGDKRIERKLNDLVSKIEKLIKKSKPSNIITIDDSMGEKFLQLSGGIASAVGNLLVFDHVSKLMKFNDNYESLGNLAKKLFDKLNRTELNLDNLYKYNFDVQAKIFPKLSFTTDKYTEINVSDFLSKLLIYTSQSGEREVEKTLKYEIMTSQGDDVQHLEVTADAIFLKYHDEVQKWKLTYSKVGKGTYLEKEGSLYKNSVKHTVKQPFLSVIRLMNKLRNKNYTLSEDALNLINLDALPSGTVIVTESIALTAVKLANNVDNKHCIVLDLEYILNLSTRDEKTLCRELINTNELKTVIIVFVETPITTSSIKKIENIANSIVDKTVFIVADQNSVECAKKYFSKAGNVVNDKGIRLTDMSEESQKLILQNTKVIFQGDEVSLGDILISKYTKDCIGGDVLNKMMHGIRNVIGKPISNPNYKSELYIPRTVRCVELKPPENIDVVLRQHSNRLGIRGRKRIENFRERIHIDTLYDLHDDVVLIIGNPGMGKSTLLTHLSVETKQVWTKLGWILRINLIEYSKEFSDWKVKKIDINALESLKFLCKVALSEEKSKALSNDLDITLEVSNGTVYLKDCTGDEWTVFELNMFLNFYSNLEVIILFDGFDEICPNYASEVLALIRAVKKCPRNHKIWISSRSYDRMNTFLELQVVKFYEIEPLIEDQQDFYLHSFWSEKGILRDLNDDHLKNIYDFITFMSQSEDLKKIIKKRDLPIDSMKDIPFLRVYYSFINYLNKNLVFGPSSVLNILHKLFYEFYENISFDNHNSVAIPLHLNIIADYLYNRIKEVNEKPINWDLDTNIFLIYEHFMVTKLKRIRFQDKTQNDMSKPDNISAYEREYADFKDKHKKLAAYAIYDKGLFDADESKQIEEMIYKLKEGEERTGIICEVVNDIPIFVHATFAEYFAVEYICDLLKSKENQKSLWDFMLNDLFFNCNMNVLATLDAKIKIDEDLHRLMTKNKKIIFVLLLKQGESTQNMRGEFKSSLCEAIRNDLPNIAHLLLATLEENLNVNNLMDFIKIVKQTNMFIIAVKMEFEESVVSIVNHVKAIDESKLILLFEDFDLNIENIGNVSVDELVNKLHKHVWTRMDIVPDWENLADLSGQIYFI